MYCYRGLIKRRLGRYKRTSWQTAHRCVCLQTISGKRYDLIRFPTLRDEKRREETHTQSKLLSVFHAFCQLVCFSFPYPFPTRFCGLASSLLPIYTLWYIYIFFLLHYFKFHFCCISIVFSVFIFQCDSACSALLNLSTLKAVISTIGSHPSNMKHNPITNRFSLMNPVMWHNQIEEDFLQIYPSDTHQTGCF